MQNGFGSGIFWGTPLTDASGNAIATPTPVQLGVLQDLSFDVSFDTKLLYGQNQFPVQAGRGKGKMAGKAKFAQLSGQAINSLVFGQTLTSGITSDVYDTTGIAIPSTPFTITANTSAPTTTTIQIPNSGTWSADLGVRNANGVPLIRVASGPTTGQYTVAAGVYVFATADVGNVVFINYQYTATSTTAKKIQVVSLPMGYAPTFKGEIFVPFQGKSLQITIPFCLCSKFSLATKQDDFLIPEFDFEGFADASGNAIYMGMSE
ncbi:MAG: hypothetical protein AB3X44_16300 [Leptothrix sp. (in: b-proteobacteria)]